MAKNVAAWLPKSQALSMVVASAPYTSPKGEEIVIENAAIAINSVDWVFQTWGTTLLFSHLKYPCIFGSDVAGKVVEVGPGVTKFRVGDSVVGHAIGQDEKRNTSAEGAFQKYTVLLTHMTGAIPKDISFEVASVLPLGLTTAACGLLQKNMLALQYPSPNVRPTGKTVLIRGGSSSVGSNAIQLAVAAGYEVFTTSSPRNFEYVKKLGASEAFDYNSPTVVHEMIQALAGKTVMGALAIGVGSDEACADILSVCKGNKFIARASIPLPKNPSRLITNLILLYNFITWTLTWTVKSKWKGVRSGFVNCLDIVGTDVGRMIYDDFLPRALADGSFVPAPPAEVVGHGLEHIQQALDIQKRGVSAKKIVVSLA